MEPGWPPDGPRRREGTVDDLDLRREGPRGAGGPRRVGDHRLHLRDDHQPAEDRHRSEGAGDDVHLCHRRCAPDARLHQRGGTDCRRDVHVRHGLPALGDDGGRDRDDGLQLHGGGPARRRRGVEHRRTAHQRHADLHVRRARAGAEPRAERGERELGVRLARAHHVGSESTRDVRRHLRRRDRAGGVGQLSQWPDEHLQLLRQRG